MFNDEYAKSQDSSKLTARRLGPYRILQLIGNNAVNLELPVHEKMHPVIYEAHTKPYSVQPHDIAVPVPQRPAPFPTSLGDEYVVGKILVPRRPGRGFRFLTLMTGSPRQDATRQPSCDSIDPDGTTTQALIDYLHKKKLRLMGRSILEEGE